MVYVYVYRYTKNRGNCSILQIPEFQTWPRATGSRLGGPCGPRTIPRCFPGQVSEAFFFEFACTQEVEVIKFGGCLPEKKRPLNGTAPELPRVHFTSSRLKIQGVQPRQFSLGRVVDNNQGCYDPNYALEPQQATFKTHEVRGDSQVTHLICRRNRRPWCIHFEAHVASLVCASYI